MNIPRCLSVAFTLVVGLFVVNARAETLVLTSGEQLIAPITERSDETLTIEHPILGLLTIPLNNVASIDGVLIGETAMPGAPRPGESPIDESVATADGAPPRSSGLLELPEEDEPEWDSKLELGLNAHAGNTQDVNFRIGFTTERETDTNILKYDASWRTASNRGDKTVDYFSTGVFSEWPHKNKRWSYFADGRFDMADFQSWDQRLTGSGGLKYYFIQDETLDASGKKIKGFDFAGRIGAGFRKEWGSDNSDIIPEGLLGLDLEWMISPQQSIKASTTYYPELTGFTEFRLVNTLDWVIKIDQMDGVSLKFGLLHEHQSEVDPSVESDDLSVYVSLVVDF